MRERRGGISAYLLRIWHLIVGCPLDEFMPVSGFNVQLKCREDAWLCNGCGAIWKLLSASNDEVATAKEKVSKCTASPAAKS